MHVLGRAPRRTGGGARLPSQHRGWRVLVVFVLVAGLGASALGATAWYSYVSSLRNQAVASSEGNLRSIMGTSLERDNDLLATVNAVVATHPRITNGFLTSILSRLDLSQQYPGNLAFTYVEKVSSADLSQFEAVTQRNPHWG